MKLSDSGLLARRRLVLFFLAILLPALVVGYLSLRAVTERREATRRILESHLYVSGEAAVRSIEAVLLEREKAGLQPGNYARLRGVGGRRPGPTTTPADAPSAASTFPGTPFLLDDQLLIVVPETGIDSPALSPAFEVAPAGEFAGMLRRAETLEHSTRDFGRAARAYRDAASRATTDREKALALAGLGRCLMATADLDEARRTYEELANAYRTLKARASPYLDALVFAAFLRSDVVPRIKETGDTYRLVSYSPLPQEGLPGPRGDRVRLAGDELRPGSDGRRPRQAETHGGSVEVESETGKGSVFSVILPIAAAETGDAT